MYQVQSADGTSIAFARDGSGPPLVLVHGATVDHTCWTPLLPLLRPHFTVCAIDRRGRGESSDAPRYAPEREVEDILAVLASLGAPAFLCGHSSGATCALQVAERAADHLRALVLYEPPLGGGARPMPADLPARLRLLAASGDRAATLRTFLREGPGASEAQINRLQRDSRGWAAMVALAHTTPYDAALVAAYVPAARRLQSLTLPTLLLLGSESPPPMHAAMAALAAALPHARIALLAGQRHAALSTGPTVLAEALIRFLGEMKDDVQ